MRVLRTYEMVVEASRERVFPLLCPVREAGWIPGWVAEVVHSESGVAERDAVFRTDLPGRGPMVWVVSVYEPPERIQYTVDRVGSHVLNLGIGLEEDGADGCRLSWRHAFTALTEEGRAFLAGFGAEAYEAQLGRIARCLRHYLGTGRMIEEGS